MNNLKKDTEDRSQLDAKYSNYFMVGHNAFEFLLDFGNSYPENEKAHFHTRVITSPYCAKALLALFREAIDQYERTFGSIRSG
jgi:hypothetical protein